ncbi:MAG: hypothetical protein II605_02075 [Paludibacteraceae bacterium]|nr:hypothetical protein [Paludibacteraceae bacterium]MBQ2520796.1 hypothetical protein [Paludibacteraceae bacterium]MBQ4018012.1 hypothetical protein [Paludibacteraceae bacterium]MBQ5379260.1 hypothetical protein [Paludibacteraceae bacterium]
MKRKIGHWGRCRIVSEVVYAWCKLLHLKGDYKINIIHHIRDDEFRERGHAWVTRDGKDLFLTPAYRPQEMSQIGENEKYRYWVSPKQSRFERRKK